MNSFVCRIVYSPKWKMLAASAASACPTQYGVGQMLRLACSAAGDDRNRHRLAHRRCDFQIVAILGAIASMLVSTISPAPSASTCFAQATASSPVGVHR